MNVFAKVALGAAVGCGLGILIASTGVLRRAGWIAEDPAVLPPAPANGPGAFWIEPEPGAAGAPHSRFAELARRASPGVVKVNTSKTVIEPGFPGFPGFPFFGPGSGAEPRAFEAIFVGSFVPLQGVPYILAAAEDVLRHFHPGMLVIMESTTYPGTTEEVLMPTLAQSGSVAGPAKLPVEKMVSGSTWASP